VVKTLPFGTSLGDETASTAGRCFGFAFMRYPILPRSSRPKNGIEEFGLTLYTPPKALKMMADLLRASQYAGWQ
jgi:hypothetical protein